MLVSVLIGLVLGILVLILNLPKVSKTARSKKTPWAIRRQLYAKGKEAGFSRKELHFLRNVALQSGMEDYASLFQKADQLDTCIRTLLWTIRVSREEDPEKQDFLGRLYECRKNIELEGTQQRLTNSYEITEGRVLRIVINYSAIYHSTVLKNTSLYLLLTRPASPDAAAAASWKGKRLSVYFWNEGDAGYVFDCTVLDEVFANGAAAIQVSHSNSLFRTQNRKSIRMKIHRSSVLSILNDEELSDEPKTEAGAGLKCFVEDLSDAGCLVAIGGKACRGMRIKIQFVLENKPITMIGTVRSVEYNGESNRSHLHVAADPLPQETKNVIFGAMFGMPPEDTNFLRE
jgi:hypothetical protein